MPLNPTWPTHGEIGWDTDLNTGLGQVVSRVNTHADQHAAGGADAISPAAIGAQPANPTAYDLCSARSNGTPTATDSGHTWNLQGTTGATPTIRGGLLTLPLGAPTSSAGYALLSLASPVLRVGGRFVLSSTASSSGGPALGAWSSTSGIPNSSSAHLAISSAYWQFGVWSGGVFTDLIPKGRLSSSVYFSTPLATDGSTVYTVDIEIDRATSTAYLFLPDGSTAVVSDPLIGSIAATHPFWEMFTQVSGDAIAGWTEIWADSAAPSSRAPQAPHIVVPRSVEARQVGAGAIYARPPSASRPGATWYDTTSSKATISTGSAWVDCANPTTVVGNRLTPNQANATINALEWSSLLNATITRDTVAPIGRTSSLKIVTTTSGISEIYINPLVTSGIAPGQTWTGVYYIRAAGTARTAQAGISWFDSGANYLSSGSGSTVSTGTGVWTKVILTGTAPSSSAQAALNVILTDPVGAGEIFNVALAALAPGTLTDYVEP